MKDRNHLVHLSALGAWAVAFGCAVGWDVLVLPLTDFLPKAGPAGTILGLAAAALAMVVIAWNFHYMMVKSPGPGGVYSYAKIAFGHDHGYICGWFLCLAYAAIVWADAEMTTIVVRYLIGGDQLHFGFKYQIAGFRVCFGDIVIVSVAVGIVAAVVAWRRVAAVVQTVLALSLAAGLVFSFGAAIFSHVGGVSSLQPFFAPAGGALGAQVLGVLMIAPWLFVGVESISCMSAEFRFPVKKSFSIMVAAIVASVVAYIIAMFIPVLAAGGEGAGWSAAVLEGGDANVRAFDMVKDVLGAAGPAILGLTLVCALFTNLIGNTVVASKLLAAMADDGAMPLWLGRHNGKLSAKNSGLAIAAVAVASSALGLTAIHIIVDVAIVGTAVAYAYTSAAAFKLARKEGSKVSAAMGVAGLVFAAAIAGLFLIPAISVSMGTVSYLALVLWCIAGLVFFLFAFHKDETYRFGRSSVVWVSLFLAIVALSHIWARQTAGETVRKTYNGIVESHEKAFHDVCEEGNCRADTEKKWFGCLRCNLKDIEDTIIRNSDVQSVLTVLALALMIAVYIAMRRRERRVDREKAEAKSYFFSTVSHDIRTPLNAIIGFSEMLKTGFPSDAEREQAVDSIISSGKTLLGLVNDILDLSKLESGKMDIAPEPTDCAKLLSEVTEAFRFAKSRAEVDVRCRAGDMPHLMLDPQRIRQIAFNLVGNAMKFTKEGHVEMRASFEKKNEASGTLRIEVEDTGCGISEEDLKRIGSAYVQVGARKSRKGGTGLGLAICKQLIAAMGGSFDVKSTLGKGSTFLITIPGVKIAEKPADPGDAGASAPAPAAAKLDTSLRILIVDDSKMNVMVLTAQLKNLGMHDISSAVNGQEALELLRSKGADSFDLVFSDMWMPILDGEGLVKAIRADPALSKLRIVVVTADVEFRASYAKTGFDDILLKPVTRDRLVELLSKEAK